MFPYRDPRKGSGRLTGHYKSFRLPKLRVPSYNTMHTGGNWPSVHHQMETGAQRKSVKNINRVATSTAMINKAPCLGPRRLVSLPAPTTPWHGTCELAGRAKPQTLHNPWCFVMVLQKRGWCFPPTQQTFLQQPWLPLVCPVEVSAVTVEKKEGMLA